MKDDHDDMTDLKDDEPTTSDVQGATSDEAALHDDALMEEGDDVGQEYQESVTKLEHAVWHAPQGRGTRIAAVIILLGIGLSIVALIVMAVVNLTM